MNKPAAPTPTSTTVTEATPPEAEVDVPQPVEVDPPKPDDEALGDAGKRALAAERTARKAAEKSAAENAAKVREYEDAQKTEAERLAARVAEAEDRAKRAETAKMRSDIVHEAGIPDDIADLVVGDDEDAMRAIAERLKAHITPQPRFAGSADPGPRNVEDTTAAGIEADIVAAQAAGNWKAVISLQNQKLAELNKSAG